MKLASELESMVAEVLPVRTLRIVFLLVLAGSFNLSKAATVQFAARAVDSSEQPLSSISVGDEFTLKVFVQDARPEPLGVFSAYVDIHYEPEFVEVVPDSLLHSPMFRTGTAGDISTPGLVDEAGGIGGLSPLGDGQFELLAVSFVAIAPGQVEFGLSAADEIPLHATTVIGQNSALPESELEFSGTEVNVIPEPSALMLAAFAVFALLHFQYLK